MFLQEPATAEAAAFLDAERAANGYVMNLERAWAWRPDVAQSFMALRKQLIAGSALTSREVALLVCRTARTLGDSYCALAWGRRLADLAGAQFAAAALHGGQASDMTQRERALGRWAERVVRDPNGCRAEHVDELRAAGLSDKEILEATVHVAFRLAFSTVNDALGARPDRELVAEAPHEVAVAVDYGRPPAR
jgi:uncharacterized peroxidase-related enzyme